MKEIVPVAPGQYGRFRETVNVSLRFDTRLYHISRNAGSEQISRLYVINFTSMGRVFEASLGP